MKDKASYVRTNYQDLTTWLRPWLLRYRIAADEIALVHAYIC